MGYFMHLGKSEILIAAKDIPQVFEAVRNLANETDRGSGSTVYGGKIVSRHFSFVNTKALLKAKGLKEALEEWNWEGVFDDEGNLVALDFPREKRGDDEVLLETMAPWVKDGSYLVMIGEENYVWKWFFKDGKCLEQDGYIEMLDE